MLQAVALSGHRLLSAPMPQICLTPESCTPLNRVFLLSRVFGHVSLREVTMRARLCFFLFFSLQART
jgi:hypothetical protein